FNDYADRRPDHSFSRGDTLANAEPADRTPDYEEGIPRTGTALHAGAAHAVRHYRARRSVGAQIFVQHRSYFDRSTLHRAVGWHWFRLARHCFRFSRRLHSVV